MQNKLAAIIVIGLLLHGVSRVGAVVHDITIGNNFFLPLGTHVQPGDTVRWTWVGAPLISHSTTSDIGSPKNWASMTTNTTGFTFEQVFTAMDGTGPFPYHCSVHSLTMKDTIHVDAAGCCVGSRGNVDGDAGDLTDIADMTLLIDHLYINNTPVACPEEANINGDSLGISLADLMLLDDHLFGPVVFPSLPLCDASLPSIGTDNGNADTVLLVAADTQMVGSDLKIRVELWFYNDANDIAGAEAGFSWDSPNLQMDSSLQTPLYQSSFASIGNPLRFDNVARQFQFLGADFAGQGLAQSAAAQHVASYYMTYSNWTPADTFSFDIVRFRNTGYGFVDVDNLTWFPQFVSRGMVDGASCCMGSRGNVDNDVNGIIDISDLTFLINHLYINNPPVPCPAAANINGDSLGINMGDLVLLIDNLFGTFPILPACNGSLPSIGIDNGIADTVRLVVADTQMVGSDLQVEVALWFYNDSNHIAGAEAGFRWNSPNLQMDSAFETPLAIFSFGSVGDPLRFDNVSQQFHFADIGDAGTGIAPSVGAQHIATYWMTYSNWTPADTILFDTARFINTSYDFVGQDNLMWFPRFVSQWIIDTLTFTSTGAAIIDTSGGVVTVSNIGSSGDDGVIIAVPGSDPFIGMEIGNIDLAVPDISLTFDITGEVSSPVGLARGSLPQQLVGAIGIATPGGAIQLSADFNAIGDPNVQFEVYNGPFLTGVSSISGGGVVAIGTNAGLGMPSITSITFSSSSPTGFTVNLDRAARFTLTNGTVLVGEKIRLLAINATGSVDLINTINVRASGIGFFTLTGVTTSTTGFCCLGFTGNINCDPSDISDIADLTLLIDHLFINFPPLCCPKEGNIDGDINGTVDIADLTALIDFLFINFTAPSACQ